MIAYSADAEPARAYLLKNYNDLDIYVEDATCQNMYVRLFNRMLDGKAKINQVFPLHSRQNVIDKCMADQSARPRRRLYIIDADQDLILGTSKPRLRHLYRLKVYCSENLLLSEGAAVTLASESKSNISWPDMAVALGFKALLEKSSEILLPLFIAYAVVYKLNLSIETVNYSVRRLLEDMNDPTSLSERLIRIRTLSILRQIHSFTLPPKHRSIRNAILRRLKRNTLDRDIYLSGKTYLLPLIHLQLQRVAKFNDSFDGLKVRLATNCELSIDQGLQRALRRALK